MARKRAKKGSGGFKCPFCGYEGPGPVIGRWRVGKRVAAICPNCRGSITK